MASETRLSLDMMKGFLRFSDHKSLNTLYKPEGTNLIASVKPTVFFFMF